MSRQSVLLVLGALISANAFGCAAETDPTALQDETLSHRRPSLRCGRHDFRSQRVDVGEVSLDVACRGSGPVIVFLHGFPEGAHAWHDVVDYLPNDVQVVIPDLRGYRRSDRPEDVDAYDADRIAADVAGLIGIASRQPVVLVGHDWGGVIAWIVSHRYPRLLRALVQMNAPHPDVFLRELAENPEQQAASSYIQFFLDPSAEAVLTADDFALLAADVFTPAFSSEVQAAERAMWAQPGQLTAMLDWYRANFGPGRSLPTGITVDVPTTVLWGMLDVHVLPGNLDGLDDYVSELTIIPFEDTDHWITHAQPEAVADAILDAEQSSRCD
jgi:epoxide hydrolase 4